MTKRMLMDASHPEETRVVIVDGTRVEELDFESRNKRQLRGNVYLARVTRVEPSLQAAFVEYGGNRHGFLAFSEIHPDYYRIPEEDKRALMEQEEADNRAENDNETIDDTATDDRDDNLDPDRDDASDEEDAEIADEQVKVASSRRKRMSRRRYKIQEVIKRGQILLIQAVKEERGNKGAAMTTYLSLAGRYCVLMPNTPRGGGISRKIANGSDRKRLKAVMSELEVPQGMGVIVRTAGAKRTKVEIKRDYDYLSRHWSEIRETTLKSIAPALIHEEGNLIKRSIRDMYNKDIEEILVQGDEAYKTAKAFIKMLMPSHAKNVKQYKDGIPLFLRFQVEKQIESSLSSVVQLKSGGYLVIHPTEALVSIDVNSGRSTKERNVERTALKTNQEAAEEIARQMRLRDLAGLVVIDFIDMDENKNNRSVEKKMKDALARDRARVQMSRISQFGLMEISRQRRRRSLLEGSTASCEHCDGVGRKRTIESSALAAIRAVEDIGARGQVRRIRLKVSPDVAVYIFNEKRDLLQHVDDSFDVFTEVVGDDTLIRPSFILEHVENRDDAGPDPLKAIEEELRRESQRSRKAAEKAKSKKSRKDEKAVSETEEHDEDISSDEKPNKRRRRGRRGGKGRSQREDRNADIADTTDTDVADIKPAEDNGKTETKSRRGRRKAPSKKAATPEPAMEVLETDTKASQKGKSRSTARRKAPAKKTAVIDTAEPAVDTQTQDEKPRSTARRKAPPKKAPADKPKTRRKAPAKKAAAKTTPVVTETVEKVTSTASARRKAPSRPKPQDSVAKDGTAETAKRTRKAPAKKTSPKKTTTTKKAAKTEASKPAAKKATARKAAPARKAALVRKTPARKAAPKKPAAKKTTAQKQDGDTAATQTAAAKKAPTKKASAKKAPARKPAPKKAVDLKKPIAMETVPIAQKTDTPPAASDDNKPKKKRGWLNRLLKD